jgi:hypothetical protein
MRNDTPGFSTAEALLYLCASRWGLGWLSKALMGVTIVAALAAGVILLIAP